MWGVAKDIHQPNLSQIIAIDVATLAEPKTFPMTVGIVEKKAPLATPQMITKTTRGARVVETGHKLSMLIAVNTKEISRE